jgi:phosphatidylserine/phosphatidylglycerophosphate/cardiolipin synthase-like enzyme
MPLSPSVAAYFATASDVEIEGEVVPSTTGGNAVEHLIDGHEYFHALRGEITTLLAGGTNRFFYFSDWRLGLAQGPEEVTSGPGSLTSAWTMDGNASGLSPFRLDDGTSPPPPIMLNQLEDMSRAGVDVRALVWISPLIVDFERAARQLGGIWTVNMHSVISTILLRARHGMRHKVVLNTLAHSLGAMHLKMVVCGDSTGYRAYVSGIDLVADRVASPAHTATELWHDATAKLRGPAALGPYDYFRALWNEAIGRRHKTFRVEGAEVRTHTDETPRVEARPTTGTVAGATQHVQVLRTVPQMNFSWFGTETVPLGCLERIFTGFSQSSLSFAEHGIFEFRLALKKAISRATSFIYVEDQSLANLEAMGWINDRLLNQPNLKVIMLYGADPTDPPNLFLDEAVRRLAASVPDPMSRIAFVRRGGHVVVHAKVTIVDDVWAAVGSANFMRRSMYTDGELSVAVLDEATPSFAQKLRKDLWGEHCGLAHGAASDVLLNLTSALGLWDVTWGSPPSGVSLKAELERMLVPFQYADPPTAGTWSGTSPGWGPEVQRAYDQQNADSRQTF